MSKPKLHHFPLFFGDLLAATPRWKGPQRSLYVLLLAYQWFDGPIPSAPKDIADMCGYPLDEFERLWQVVGKKFVECDGGLINLRCEEHREKVAKISKKRSTAGKKGGDTTRQKVKQTGQQTGKQIEQQIEQQTGVANEGAVATPFAGPSNPIQSNPILSNPTHVAHCVREIPRARPPEPIEQGMSDAERRDRWSRCQQLFPPYNGRKNWIMAESAASNLVSANRGTWDQIEAATKRYGEFCRATNRQVMRPENFFSTETDPPCLQAWEIPEPTQPASVTKTRGDAVLEEFFKDRANSAQE